MGWHSQDLLAGSRSSRNKRRHAYYDNPKVRTLHIPHTAREVLGVPKKRYHKQHLDTSSDMVLEALHPVLSDSEKECIRLHIYCLVILAICAELAGYSCKSGRKSLEIVLAKLPLDK